MYSGRLKVYGNNSIISQIGTKKLLSGNRYNSFRPVIRSQSRKDDFCATNLSRTIDARILQFIGLLRSISAHSNTDIAVVIKATNWKSRRSQIYYDTLRPEFPITPKTDGIYLRLKKLFKPCKIVLRVTKIPGLSCIHTFAYSRAFA